MKLDVRPSDFIPSHLQEALKVHLVYDVRGRMVEQYEAQANALHGAKALKTSYQYDGTTTRIIGMKEEVSTWDSAWDF